MWEVIHWLPWQMHTSEGIQQLRAAPLIPTSNGFGFEKIFHICVLNRFQQKWFDPSKNVKERCAVVWHSHLNISYNESNKVSLTHKPIWFFKSEQPFSLTVSTSVEDGISWWNTENSHQLLSIHMAHRIINNWCYLHCHWIWLASSINIWTWKKVTLHS